MEAVYYPSRYDAALVFRDGKVWRYDDFCSNKAPIAGVDSKGVIWKWPHNGMDNPVGKFEHGQVFPATNSAYGFEWTAIASIKSTCPECEAVAALEDRF